MDIQKQCESLRAPLLRMSRLSQRAVDYSIKGYELGRPEFSREVQSTERELRNLRLSIADRGRMVLPIGMPISVDSRFTCYALRVCNALQSTYNAAAAIALETIRGLENGRRIEISVVGEMGQFVNSLVRICTIALFNEDLHRARTVLRNDGGRRWFSQSLRQAQAELAQRSGSEAGCELAIVENLHQIAERSYEVAHEIAFRLEGQDCFNPARRRTPFLKDISRAMRGREQAGAA